MRRFAAILLLVLGLGLCVSATASARPYGWYGYRPYYRPYAYGPGPYWAGAYYRPPAYCAYYPGGAALTYGYPAYGYPSVYRYGYPGFYYGGYVGPWFGFYGW